METCPICQKKRKLVEVEHDLYEAICEKCLADILEEENE